MEGSEGDDKAAQADEDAEERRYGCKDVFWALHSLHVFWDLHSFVFFPSTSLCSLVIRVGVTTNLEGGSGRAVDLPSFF